MLRLQWLTFLLMGINVFAADLLPVPALVQYQTGKLAIRGSIQVTVQGHTDARLRAGIDRMIQRLEKKTGLAGPPGASLSIECQGPGATVPALGEDESYSLEVSSQQAQLKAATVVGVLRGLETFLQLVAADGDGYYLPAVSIHDTPRFPWRGLLIDVCRHWEPVEVIKRNLDGMAA